MMRGNRVDFSEPGVCGTKVSRKIRFEHFFVDDDEDTITYYFICDDREMTDQIYGHRDYGEEIKGFTVSVEVSMRTGGDIFPTVEMSPFVCDEDETVSDIDWEEVYLPLDEILDLTLTGSRHYQEYLRSRIK